MEGDIDQIIDKSDNVPIRLRIVLICVNVRDLKENIPNI